MKKKLLGMVVVAVVAIVAGYNVYISQNETKLSDLVLANVEAFAWGGETNERSNNIFAQTKCCYSAHSHS